MQQAQAQEGRAQAQEQRAQQEFDQGQIDKEANRMIGLFNSFYGPWAREAKKSGDVRQYVTASLRNPGFRQRVEQDGIFDLNALDPNSPELEHDVNLIAGFGAEASQNDGTPSNVREWEYYNSLKPEQQQQYLEMKRSQQTFLPTINEVPTIVRPGVAGGPDTVKPLSTLPQVASAKGTVAGAEQAAQEAAKTNAIPARSQAERDADQAKLQQQNARAFATYTAAMKGLENAMAQTSTGPVSGRMPSVTAAQQTAEGAVAAMAPVLKGLFRNAGEGTFTDKDQEILLAMVPTRKDHPEARAAKIANINMIVASKLGLPTPGGSDSPVHVSTPDEAARLAPGTQFVTPDGQVRVRH
jgi:hypothetical protein